MESTETSHSVSPAAVGQERLQKAPLRLCQLPRPVTHDPTSGGQNRWTLHWKTALNAFDITFDDRLSAARE